MKIRQPWRKLSFKKISYSKRIKLIVIVVSVGLIALSVLYKIQSNSTRDNNPTDETGSIQSSQEAQDQNASNAAASGQSNPSAKRSSTAQPAFKVLSVSLSATRDARPRDIQRCVGNPPVSFNDVENFDFMSVSAAGVVTYHWVVKDGPYVYESPKYTLTFDRAGGKDIPKPFSFRMINTEPSEERRGKPASFDVIIDSPNSTGYDKRGLDYIAIFCPENIEGSRPEFFMP